MEAVTRPARNGGSVSRTALWLLVAALALAGLGVAVPTLLRSVPTPEQAAAGAHWARGPAVSSGAPLVTPGVARQVTTRLWGLWQGALVHHDTRVLAEVDVAGVQTEEDSANCGRATSHYRLFIPCHTMPVVAISVLVPAQHHYPVDFLAQVKSTEWVTTTYGIRRQTPRATLVLLVVTRSGPSAPWKIAFRTTYFGLSPERVRFLSVPRTASGFDRTARVTTPVPPDAFAGLLGAYYQSCWTVGAPPTPTAFIPGPFTTGRCGQISTVHASGKTIEYSKTPTAGDTWTFGVGVRGFVAEPFTLQAPWAMVCTRVTFTIVDVPPNGDKAMVQTETEIQFGPELRSGEYTRVVRTGSHDACVITNGQVMSVLADSDTTYRSAGTPITVTGQTGQVTNEGTIPLGSRK